MKQSSATPKINKYVKISLVIVVTGLLTYGIISYIKKRKEENEGDSIYIDTGTGATPQKIIVSKTIDRNLVLSDGSTGDEVKALQKILGFTGRSVDGVFGPKTLAALQSQTGLSQITLGNIEAAISALKAQNASASAIAKVKASFPIGKSVIAATKIRAFVNLFRNNDWFSTDNDGNPMPSKEFNATANVGKVYGYRKSDPTIVIVELANTIDGYRYAAFKSSWLK